MDVFTIGFTQSTAEHFFARLQAAGVKRVVDVRLHNNGQLAGFAKVPDLGFFCERIAGIGYVHEPALAPEEELMKAFKGGGKMPWAEFERGFLGLMAQRQVEKKLDPKLFDGACLLCSEAKPHQCHRRLVCDYLNAKWDNRLTVHHL